MKLSNALTSKKLQKSVPSITEEQLSDRLANSFRNIVQDFILTYDTTPDFVTKSPGRVNLVGEHLDYADFAVLPMAIEVEVLCAVKILPENENPSITLTNSDEKFAQRRFDLPLDGSLISIDPSVSDWSNYFKCGLLVAQKYLNEKFPERFEQCPLIGMNVFVSGNVPSGGGLSSSSAFICSVALAVIRANTSKDYQIAKEDLTQITVKSEHYVGVNNGGMDQAASVCGEIDHALYVEFKPEFRASPFKLPELQHSEVQFIIADTLIVSNKFETAPTNYNLRVVEVTVAANFLAARYGVVLQRDGNLNRGTLRGFMNAFYGHYYGINTPWDGNVEDGIERLTVMLKLVEETFTQHQGYTVDQISKVMECSSSEFTRDYLTNFPVRFQVLKLYQRAKHVYSEALRVLKALKLLTKCEFSSDEEFLTLFGNLMDASQESCDKLFECSCPETDEICQIARANGSYGSRLTGAGWGGCTVHLVPATKVEQVQNALIEQYYKKRHRNLTTELLKGAILVSKPAFGSCIIEL
ncbi:LAFE_0H16248g1_1 [Lachancea fermentati]|uniref:Galactokinase n=1 Tax=Lachancea fermentati TaxID=4955 RepID=A0A1G4MKZ1_LACFM|nr:LAFE_0H16248g1_1 [Lachancea fermentati]